MPKKDTKELVRASLPETVELERPAQAPVSTGRYPDYRAEQPADGFNLVDYWRAVRKRLWLVAGITVLITTLTAIYMARKPDIYSAHAKVQVDLEQANPDLVTADRPRPSVNADPAYFNTQLQLLQSDGLLRRVVKDHQLDTNKEFQTVKGGSPSAWRSILRSLGLASPEKPDQNKPPAADSSVATSEEIAEAIRLAPFVTAIKNNLQIDPVREARATVKDTRLIDISYSGTNPDFTAYVANSIAETFTIANQEKRSGTSRKTNDFLQERINSLQSEVQNDEQRLVQLTQNAGILKTDGEQTIVIDRLAGLNKQLLDAENARKNAEANFLTVSNSPDKLKALVEQEMAQYIMGQENNIRALQSDILKKIADLRSKRTEKLTDFQEGAPEIKEIDNQIASYQDTIDKAVKKLNTDLEGYRKRTTNGLLENLRTKYLQAKDAEDKIRVDFDKQYAEAQGQNKDAVDIKLLQQNIDTNKGFLENLRKQVSGNDVASQGTDNNISVIEIAVPSDTPVSPRRAMSVFAAFLLSIMFGIGLALFLEYLDDTIRTSEEVENYLRLPALAAIPTMDAMPKRRLSLVGAADDDEGSHDSPLLIAADPRSSLAEWYRHLRTSILLSTAGHAPKSLLVTSSLPSEGKTTTATNTAISLAQTGAKVLLVDADMRRPRLHSIFDIGNNTGLSTLLASELTEDEVLSVVQHDERSKLYLLPSGPIPPNPAELIGSDHMANLLQVLQGMFGHVVIDSPPIASFTDGVLIASMVDGVILVVHAGHSSRQVVARSRQLLQDIGAKIFGVVLNHVKMQGKDHSYYYHGYGQDSADA